MQTVSVSAIRGLGFGLGVLPKPPTTASRRAEEIYEANLSLSRPITEKVAGDGTIIWEPLAEFLEFECFLSVKAA